MGKGVKLSPSPLQMHNYPSPQILLYMGRSQTFLTLQYKAILLCKLFPTWGRVKFSSAKMHSYPSRHSLPILCREGFFSIMQNFYKSFPTNLYFFFPSFFILSLLILFFTYLLFFFLTF